jgi:hypothetical protein
VRIGYSDCLVSEDELGFNGKLTSAFAALRFWRAAFLKSTQAASSSLIALSANGERGPLVTIVPKTIYSQIVNNQTRQQKKRPANRRRERKGPDGPESLAQVRMGHVLRSYYLQYGRRRSVRRQERWGILALQGIDGIFDDGLCKERSMYVK